MSTTAQSARGCPLAGPPTLTVAAVSLIAIAMGGCGPERESALLEPSAPQCSELDPSALHIQADSARGDWLSYFQRPAPAADDCDALWCPIRMEFSAVSDTEVRLHSADADSLTLTLLLPPLGSAHPQLDSPSPQSSVLVDVRRNDEGAFAVRIEAEQGSLVLEAGYPDPNTFRQVVGYLEFDEFWDTPYCLISAQSPLPASCDLNRRELPLRLKTDAGNVDIPPGSSVRIVLNGQPILATNVFNVDHRLSTPPAEAGSQGCPVENWQFPPSQFLLQPLAE